MSSSTATTAAEPKATINCVGSDTVIEMSMIADEGMLSRSESDSALAQEITPLLAQGSGNGTTTTKINIFSVSYPRRKPREHVMKLAEAETAVFSQLMSWAWGGSRYSGLLCAASSTIIYCLMGALSETFSAQPIPLLETAFTRCVIILMLSYFWLRRTGQPIFGPVHARKLFIGRAIMGFIQRLPLSEAIVLSFCTPLMAAAMARFILHEKLKIEELGGLTCSFFGLILIFWPIFTAQEAAEVNSVTYAVGSSHIFALVLGLFSSISGGVSYCLIRAGAKASDQPVVTVFSFSLLGGPATALCIFIFQDIVFPSVYTLILMIILGLLAFLAQVLLARGLHLEKTSKTINIIYIEAILSHLWGIGSYRFGPSFGGLSGCLLILISVCSTVYFGPDTETE
ncbi:putative membrane protein [Drosera capensis]